MSLTVVVKGRDGVVLATDSRRVLQFRGRFATLFGDRYLAFDDEEKLWAFEAPHNHVGVVLYGLTTGIGCSMRAWRADFERQLPAERLSTEEYARQLGEFLVQQRQPRMIATIGGVDADGTARVFVVDTADGGAEPVEQHPGGVGIVYGGQREFVDRLLQGYDARVPDMIADGLEIGPDYRDGFGRAARESLGALAMQIPLATFDLAACAELAEFLLRTTADAQRFIVGLRGVGGPIDVAAVTSEGPRWVRREEPCDAATPPTWHEVGDSPSSAMDAPADGVAVATFSVK